MKFILFIMFLIAPPSGIQDSDKETKRDTRVWALQSTTTMEFSSIKLCQEIGESIQRNARVTATITTRFYCFPKDETDLDSLISQQEQSRVKSFAPAAALSKADKAKRDEAIDKATTFKLQ